MRWVSSAAIALLFIASSASAQQFVIREQLGRGFAVGFGRFEAYPPNPNPYAGRVHGPSPYAGYGSRRLEGRILWLPGGIAPPGPQAIERFTVGRIGPQPTRPVPSPPVVPKRYPHATYQRSNYHHPGYQRRY
jgi:hypothetical protein